MSYDPRVLLIGISPNVRKVSYVSRTTSHKSAKVWPTQQPEVHCECPTRIPSLPLRRAHVLFWKLAGLLGVETLSKLVRDQKLFVKRLSFSLDEHPFVLLRLEIVAWLYILENPEGEQRTERFYSIVS